MCVDRCHSSVGVPHDVEGGGHPELLGDTVVWGWRSPQGRGTLWPGAWMICLWLGCPCCVRSGGRPGGGVPHYGGDRGHPELQVPCGVVDRGHPGLGEPHGVENGGCFGVEDPPGECCGDMRPSGFCALKVWGQLRCPFPMTHISERPLGSFPMAGRAPRGPDLDPSPCFAACPSLDLQGAAWGCASVYPPSKAAYPNFWTPRTAAAGEGLCC